MNNFFKEGVFTKVRCVHSATQHDVVRHLEEDININIPSVLFQGKNEMKCRQTLLRIAVSFDEQLVEDLKIVDQKDDDF